MFLFLIGISFFLVLKQRLIWYQLYNQLIYLGFILVFCFHFFLGLTWENCSLLGLSVMLQNKNKNTMKQKHQIPVCQRGTKGVSDVFFPILPHLRFVSACQETEIPPDNVWALTTQTPTTESKPGINAIHEIFPRSVNCPKKELVACAWVYSSSSVDKNTTHRHLGPCIWPIEVRPAATTELFIYRSAATSPNHLEPRIYIKELYNNLDPQVDLLRYIFQSTTHYLTYI